MPKSATRPTFGPHDLQEGVDVRALLDVVGQMEMRVVDDVAAGGGLRDRGPREEGQGQAEQRRFREQAHQKFISKFVWKTFPLPPTG
jgi:hypothetical protein